MKEIKIEELATADIPGVSTPKAGTQTGAQESYFVWEPSPLIANFKSTAIGGGFLKTWCHAPIFDEVETHEDKEAFFFVTGTALMLFGDVRNGQVLSDSLRIVRIKPHTELIIDAGKAHFVAVAEGDSPVQAVVISPHMTAPKIKLNEPVHGF